MKGLYIHIPFCKRKCGYCDFYSINFNSDLAVKYQNEIKNRLKNYTTVFDTVYFGGGTPSIIGDGVADILSVVKTANNAEITAECNPDSATDLFLSTAVKAGVNRLSIGLQSANDDELKTLTRPHTARDVETAINKAREYGISNISLDVMMGYKGQTINSLKSTLDFCIRMNVNHISAYMLKIEENTAFAKAQDIISTDDDLAKLYEFCCDYLEENGYCQYEISNFAKTGFECRHNLIYWNSEDYLGLGPAAHSFWQGKRYHFNRDISAFLEGDDMICDGDGGDFDEYVMLRLRLNSGLLFSDLECRGYTLPRDFISKCKTLSQNGLAEFDGASLKLTKKGLLVQNSVLGFLL